MTETTNTMERDAAAPPQALPLALEAFVLQWGDLGTQWGVNRSVSQIHAFLYLQEHPVTAERIAEVLGVARSNVSNSLKELLGWGLVHRVPVRGDRRDHFAAETDMWEIAQRIAEGRKRREIDPALQTLGRCVAQAEGDPTVTKVERERLEALHGFMREADDWFAQMLAMPRERRETLMRLGAKIAKFLPAPRTQAKRKE